jgi:hypothetical protein
MTPRRSASNRELKNSCKKARRLTGFFISGKQLRSIGISEYRRIIGKQLQPSVFHAIFLPAMRGTNFHSCFYRSAITRSHISLFP